ncbi:hypothetical protein GLOIN_2v882189 [Rhizophagus clarus]|uniref:Uncharacterized protein n=1 Tax=Rhizophagus clarus TaxID=94130 RepID=A0A8H3L8L1_9GLOM|nr:hypothetical protein GLOIN_2v882189 [Rhizophagus clarus]
MVTFVPHDHMTHDVKKLLQQSSVKKFFSFVNFLLNSPSTPHQLSHQKISSTGLRLKEYLQIVRIEEGNDMIIF